MLAAIYLDPRHSFKLSAEETKIAKITLANLYERVGQAKLQLRQSQPEPISDEADSFEDECVSTGQSRIYSKKNLDNTMLTDNDSLFAAYENIGRIHNKKSILEFWDEHSTELPILYELASIIHAIPPSQCTVERAFSILGYIYNSRRTKLSPPMLEAILMINLNRDLVEAINKKDLNAIS